ncbi:MAG: 30S ribosomal protein S4 [Nanoarchaeota archaeon]|nr:30S ribosomal protein S4 [Nanoarchaeota archaeon]
MKRKHKKYSRPKTPFDKERLEQEAKLKKIFGLKNKKEIWRAQKKINSIRTKAKNLISSGEIEKKEFFDRLGKIGLKVNSLAEVLSLNVEDYLKRRLQTVLIAKNLAKTPKQARQLITHKKVLIKGRAVDSPSYVVPVLLEDKILIKKKNKKIKEKVEDKKEVEGEQDA